MKFSKAAMFAHKLVLLISLSVGLNACGGAGGGVSAPSSDTQLRGIFVDEFVVNLEYKTANHSGLTDSTGAYNYDVLGENIAFSFGGTLIGYGSADAFITPYDLKDGSGNPIDPINLALFMQSLDDDGNPDNGIVLPTTINITLPASIDFNNRTEIEQLIIALGYTPRDISDVEAHLETSMANVTRQVLAPGKYKVSTYWASELVRPQGEDDHFLTCPIGYTALDVSVTETAIIGSFIGVNDGITHSFDVPRDSDYFRGITDTGLGLRMKFRSIEYGEITIHNVDYTGCFNVFRLDRENGLNLPPMGAISTYHTPGGVWTYGVEVDPTKYFPDPLEAMKCYTVGDSILNIINDTNASDIAYCAPYYPVNFTDGSGDFIFYFTDPDGWITSATVEWNDEAGGSGVIDLLTKSNDVGHFVHQRQGLEDVNTGVITEWFFSGITGEGYLDTLGLPPIPAPGDFVRAGESNPSNVFGVFVTRGRTTAGTGNGYWQPGEFLDGPISLTLKLTDNEGYNFSVNYVINDPGIVVNSDFPVQSGTYRDSDSWAWDIVDANARTIKGYQAAYVGETCLTHWVTSTYTYNAGLVTENNVYIGSSEPPNSVSIGLDEFNALFSDIYNGNPMTLTSDPFPSICSF